MNPLQFRSRASSRLLYIAFSALLAFSTTRAEISPAAQALVQSVESKLGTAQTIKLTAKHQMDPRIAAGFGHERGPLHITVKRPANFFITQSAGRESRILAFNGSTLSLMHPELKHHAIVPLKAGSISQLADRMDEKFGFRPPVAELLSQDLSKQLFLNVTDAKIVGQESIGWTRCDRLHFVQPGMTGDLWVGVKDKLPRRYLLTFTDIHGNPTWDIRLKKWELNKLVDDSLFSKRPAADSSPIPMVKAKAR